MKKTCIIKTQASGLQMFWANNFVMVLKLWMQA